MQNQKKPIQQKKPMQNFTAEKWADKIALFIDNFGFLSGFFWHWTIALPSPTSHLAMLHSKIILSDPNRRVKVVLIGFSLFWSRCRTWGTLWLTCRPGWQWQCTTYRSNSDWYVVQIICRPWWLSGWSVGVALRVIFWCSPHTASPLWNKNVIFWWSWTASQRGMKNILDQLPPLFHPWTTLPYRDNRFHLGHCHPKTSPGSQNRPCNPKNGPSTPQCA